MRAGCVVVAVLVCASALGQQVLELDAQSPVLAGGNDEGLWLLEFFAPWCSHCRRLAPVLDEVAEELGSTARVGKLNCDDHQSLCEQFAIKSFPTLLVKSGEMLQHFGLARTKDRIVSFVRAFATGAVVELSAEDVQSLITTNTLAHVLFADDVPAWFTATATQRQGEVRFGVCRACDAAALGARSNAVAAFRDGHVFSLGVDEGEHGFGAFVDTHRFGVLPQMDQTTFPELAAHRRLLVVAAVDPTHLSTDSVKEAVGGVSLERGHEFTFAWIDANALAKFAKQYQVATSLPAVVVLDNEGDDGWYVMRNHVTDGVAINAFLDRVLAGKEQNLDKTWDKELMRSMKPHLMKLSVFVEEYLNALIAGAVLFVLVFVTCLVACSRNVHVPAPRDEKKHN